MEKKMWIHAMVMEQRRWKWQKGGYVLLSVHPNDKAEYFACIAFIERTDALLQKILEVKDSNVIEKNPDPAINNLESNSSVESATILNDNVNEGSEQNITALVRIKIFLSNFLYPERWFAFFWVQPFSIV